MTDLHIAGPALHVHDDDRRGSSGNNPGHRRIMPQCADVVDDICADAKRGRCDNAFSRIDGNGDVGIAPDRFNDREDTIEFHL